jgi:hypothetical protein
MKADRRNRGKEKRNKRKEEKRREQKGLSGVRSGSVPFGSV